MSHIVLRTPIIGALPHTFHAAAEGTYNLLSGLGGSLLCDERGPKEMQLGARKIALIPIILLGSLINLNPWRAPITRNDTLCTSQDVGEVLDETIASCSNSLLKRFHVLAGAPCLMIARVADLAIGALSLLFALLAGGMSQTLNNRAASHLLAGASLIRDAQTTVVRLIAPDLLEFEPLYENKDAWYFLPYLPTVKADQ